MTSTPAAPALSAEQIASIIRDHVHGHMMGEHELGGIDEAAAEIQSAMQMGVAALAAPAPAEVGEDLSDDEIFMLSKWEAHRGGAWKPEDPNSDLICRLIDGHFVRRLWDGDAPRDGFGKPFPADSFIGWTDAGRRLMQTLSAPRPSRDDAGQAVASAYRLVVQLRELEETFHFFSLSAAQSKMEQEVAKMFSGDYQAEWIDGQDNDCLLQYKVTTSKYSYAGGFIEVVTIEGTHPPAPSAEAGRVGELLDLLDEAITHRADSTARQCIADLRGALSGGAK